MKRTWMAVVLAAALLAGLIPAGGSASAAGRETEGYAELVRLCAGQEYVGEIQFQLDSTGMTVDGETVPIDPEQEGITPLAAQGRTMLPARALVEALNGSIGYEDGLVTITAGDGVRIELAGGENTMRVDGREIRLDAAPMYAQNRTFLPVRAVSESLGCEVSWEPDARQVTITQPCQTCRLVVQAERRLPSTSPSQTLELGGGLYVLVYSTVAETRAALQTLTEAGIPAWPDAPVEVEAQGNAAAGWEDARCGLSDFARLQAGSRPVTVAVIDSGIDGSLPLFQGRLAGGFDFVEGRAGIPEDRYGHGTFVSGLIAQYTPQHVRLLPIRIFDEDGLCPVYLSVLAAALRYAQQSGAELVNMSLSAYRSPVLEQMVRSLIAQDVAVVCSAGNEGRDTSHYTPAGMDEAIVVAATGPADLPAGFSNHGASVDLAAPGQGITSVGAGGKTQVLDGTSFSAPLVSAAGAVLLTRRDYTPAGLERTLRACTVPFADGGLAYGAGILSLHTPQDSPANPEPAPVPTPEPGAVAYRYSTDRLSLAAGETAALRVSAVYPDGSTRDVTEACGLYSTAPRTAQVQNGVVTALEPGTAQISMGAVPGGVALPAPVAVEVKPEETQPEPDFDFHSQEMILRPGFTGSLFLRSEQWYDYTVEGPDIVSVMRTVRTGNLYGFTEYSILALGPGAATVTLSPRNGGRPIQVRVFVLS